MSKSKKKAPAKQSTKTPQPKRPELQRPDPKKFGTNPATNERHVHVEPELMPEGPGSYLDSAETMLA